MEFQLNPEAKEFVPTSPDVNNIALSIDSTLLICSNIVNDDFVIAQSPRKGGIAMENIHIPSVDDFEEDISNRPMELEYALKKSELSPSLTCGDRDRSGSSDSSYSFQEMNLKEAMHGDEKSVDEYQTNIVTNSSLPQNADNVEELTLQSQDGSDEENRIVVDMNAIQLLPQEDDDDELNQQMNVTTPNLTMTGSLVTSDESRSLVTSDQNSHFVLDINNTSRNAVDDNLISGQSKTDHITVIESVETGTYVESDQPESDLLLAANVTSTNQGVDETIYSKTNAELPNRLNIHDLAESEQNQSLTTEFGEHKTMSANNSILENSFENLLQQTVLPVVGNSIDIEPISSLPISISNVINKTDADVTSVVQEASARLLTTGTAACVNKAKVKVNEQLKKTKNASPKKIISMTTTVSCASSASTRHTTSTRSNNTTGLVTRTAKILPLTTAKKLVGTVTKPADEKKNPIIKTVSHKLVTSTGRSNAIVSPSSTTRTLPSLKSNSKTATMKVPITR